MREKYMVGNWKMNQDLGSIKDFFGVLKSEKFKASCHSWIAPQAMHLSRCLELGGEIDIQIGAQNCSQYDSGAYTGELSPKALKDLGVSFTLVGHSERRTLFHESHETLNAKTKSALKEGLKVIFCIGETLEQREANRTFSVLKEQLEKGLKDIKTTPSELIVAYEPVWAIGTGKTATPEMANEAHEFVRGTLKELGLDENTSILYGGSVKPANVEELLAQPHIDGGLVGGASLKSSDFRSLTAAASV